VVRGVYPAPILVVVVAVFVESSLELFNLH
jgi:hypothetical protein